MGGRVENMVLNASWWATRAGCLLFTMGMLAGILHLVDVRDPYHDETSQYNQVLQAWPDNRKSFELAARSSHIKVAAHLYNENGAEHASLPPTEVNLQEDTSSMLTELGDEFGDDLQPLSYTGSFAMPTDKNWDGTITLTVGEQSVDIPRVWMLPIKGAGAGLGDSPSREMQYTLQSICVRVSSRETVDEAAEWHLDPEQPASFVRPLSPAQEVISDPMPVGCSERNLDLRFRAGYNTQRLRLWGAGVYKQGLQLMAHDLEYPREIPVTVMSAEDPQISAYTITYGNLRFPQTVMARRMEGLIVIFVAFCLCGWAPYAMGFLEKCEPTEEEEVEYHQQKPASYM